MTLLGIEWVRIQHGLNLHFATPISQGKLFITLTSIYMLQLGVMFLGYRVMQFNGYLKTRFNGDQVSPVSFGLTVIALLRLSARLLRYKAVKIATMQ